MRKRILVLLLAVMAVPLPVLAQRDQWIRGSTTPIDLPNGSRVEFHEIQSEALGQARAFSIFLPPSYASSESTYPAVYFLHGLFNDHSSWTMDERGDIPARVDALMADGALPEMVLVFPDGGKSFYTNYRDGSGDFEDFIVKDVPSHVETHYRVESSPRRRAIAGTSMGGYGALKIAMRHPEHYAGVAAHSPIVFPLKNPLDVPPEARSSRQYQYLSGIFRTVYGDPFDQAYYDENNPLELASREGVSRLAIYFDYGTADRYNRSIGLGLGLQKLDAALSSQDVAHTFVTHEGEPHGWELVHTHIADSLSFLARAFTD